MFWRLFRSMMTSEAKKVPIPPRGVDYRGKVVLAPMVRSGELPSRLLALQYGADLVWGPETIDKSLIGTTRRVNPRTGTVEWSRMPSHCGLSGVPKESVLYRVHPQLEGSRLIFQLGTSDPETAVAAARLVAADVAGIDVNAGCPKPFSTGGGMGAALLKTPDRLVAILEALVAAIPPVYGIGISVKIRLLADAADTERLVRRLVATGITGLTVHCRTTPMRPRERAIRAQLPMVAGVCRAAGVACLMNGDVVSRDHAMRLLAEYDGLVDGAMIATAAEKNSSCFRAEADGGLAGWRDVARSYLRHCIAVENRFGNTKYLLAQIVPGRQAEFMGVARCHSYVEMVDALGFGREDDDGGDGDGNGDGDGDHNDYTALREAAHATDVALGIDPESLQTAQSLKDANRLALKLAKRKMQGYSDDAAAAASAADGKDIPGQHKRLKSDLAADDLSMLPQPAREAVAASM